MDGRPEDGYAENSEQIRETDMKRLEGKVAVVTGGNSGIGLATAKRLQEEGARVAISGRSKKTLDEAVRTIGNGVVAVQADVANLADVDKLYAEVSQKLGKIDVLFVNAGIVTFAPLAETTESAYDEQFDINIKGAYFTIQKALPFLNDGASVSLALPNFVPGPPGASLLPAGAWPSPARCRCFHRSPPPLFLRDRKSVV